MKTTSLFGLAVGLITIFAVSGCTAPRQLTAEEARIKYGNPYSQPSVFDRSQKKLPPIPIDPALRQASETE